MLIIRTEEDMTRAMDSPLDPSLRARLAAHCDHVKDYPDFTFEELGVLAIVQHGDPLDALNTASASPLVREGRFICVPEAVDRHGHWLELLFILSDDGFGLILFVPWTADTDGKWVSACKALAPHLEAPAAL